MPRTDDYDPLMDELPPELAAEYRKEKRRQRISESMLQQSMQPITGEGRHSPLQGIAKLVQAYMGSRGMDEGDSRLADIGARGAQGRQEAYGAMTRAMQGTPEQVQELPADVMGPPQITPAVPGGPDAMIQAGLNSPYTQKIAQAMMLEKMKSLPMMQFKAEEAKLMRDQRMKELEMRLEDQRLSREDRASLQREIAQMRIDAAREMKQMAGALGKQNPYFSPFDSAQGAMVFDHRTGKMVPAMVDGKPLVKASSDPTLQGDIAGAKEAGQAKAKRAINMAGLGDTIKEAEDLLSGASGKALPTGSSVGAAVDWVGGLVGANPEGAKEAQTLKAIGGALTSKMPRMEGPQSDKDTQLYREMAAVVGDSTVPRERRLAALEKVKELWGKYETQQPNKSDATTKPNDGAVRVVDW